MDIVLEVRQCQECGHRFYVEAEGRGSRENTFYFCPLCGIADSSGIEKGTFNLDDFKT